MAPKTPGPLAVLVVEDEPVIRRLICHTLESNSFRVFETGLAANGLTLHNSHPEIALAIVDMVMPGMSGLDLAAEMSRRHPEIRILYITGYVASIAIQAIADRHPEAVLLKPFTGRELMGCVRKLLEIPAAPGDTGAAAVQPAMTVKAAWERLIEGSDFVPHPYRIASYRDTPVAYSIAAAHAAVLRAAEIPYHFAYNQDLAHPFQLLAPAEQWRAALDVISMLGLSADIAIAA